MLAASVTLLLLSAPQTPGLRWRAPAGCPSQADATEYLQTELHGDPARGSSDVRVEPTPTGWRAEIRIDDGDPRELNAASCADLMAAAMVMIAVTLDAQPDEASAGAELVVPVVPALPEPVPPAASTPEPQPRPEPPPSVPLRASTPETPTSSSRLSHWIAADAGVARLHVPAIAARLGARYVLRGREWAVRMGGHYETPRRQLYPDTTVGGRFWAIAATVLACYEPGRGSLTAALCAGPAAGAVVGVGEGVPSARTPRAPWVGAHAVAGFRWAWSEKWRLSVDGLFAVALYRPAFHVGDREPLFRSPRLGGAGMIGIERRLR